MLETKLIKGAEPAAIDREILAVAKKHSRNPWRGVHLDGLICNEAGIAYRTIRIYDRMGFSDFVDDVKAKFGLIDRVGYSPSFQCLIDDFTGERLRLPVSAYLQFDRTPHPFPTLPLTFAD